ncbi:GAF and ANTAR domain-containing protein [Pseudoclavibacter sp. RFBA6]|uniref:GAF and ANTAR domain-containing protein n=1 Tax=Pseudoclavibacter sp. RFBA6 TaxID=2080573 RepID=UPI000CE78E76|nr:GAF and ANTAR domain-containing protein [Pseudoclavibacter sp. RFBA6]PPG38744.1 transcriptional regulator [Pseudoclavibacter sp. RFBA6]
MSHDRRETLLLETFAILADSLVADYDVVDLLQTLVDRCQELLDTTAAGILLADEHGDLEIVASTSESASVVETMQISAAAGPCIESFTAGRTVSLADVRDAPAAWQQFKDSALAHGYLSVHAVPLRLRDTTLGTLNLLRAEAGELPERDIVAARALADVATIGILQERAIRETETVRQQLQHALTSRVIIEQAKGVVAYRHSITPEEGFEVIRSYARSNNLSISRVAADLVKRMLTI